MTSVWESYSHLKSYFDLASLEKERERRRRAKKEEDTFCRFSWYPVNLPPYCFSLVSSFWKERDDASTLNFLYQDGEDAFLMRLKANLKRYRKIVRPDSAGTARLKKFFKTSCCVLLWFLCATNFSFLTQKLYVWETSNVRLSRGMKDYKKIVIQHHLLCCCLTHEQEK